MRRPSPGSWPTTRVRLDRGEAPERAFAAALGRGRLGARPLTERGRRSPLLVWGEVLRDYDFGPGHPLTPRRFGPGIDLLRALGRRTARGARRRHRRRARAAARARTTSRRCAPSATTPGSRRRWASGTPDVPAFHGMHEAAALVAGGSIEAVERHPAPARLRTPSRPPAACTTRCARAPRASASTTTWRWPSRAARDAGHRVLYVDLDVHHGDGTQALFWDDPAVLTFSVHETGRSLFPGTGMVDETGGRDAPGTAVNVPLDDGLGDESWWPVVELVLPALAEALPADLPRLAARLRQPRAAIPLAHLRVTTAAYAARLRDSSTASPTATARAAGWPPAAEATTPTGVVPRSWALVWLAQAHREAPAETPADWRERWADVARCLRPAAAAGRPHRPAGHGGAGRRTRIVTAEPGAGARRRWRRRCGSSRTTGRDAGTRGARPAARALVTAQHPLGCVGRGDRHERALLEGCLARQAERA